MIIYRKACGGCFLLMMPSGAIMRALVPASLAAIWGVALETYGEALGIDLHASFLHPYPYQVFTLVFGFLLVFRTTFAYNRYWSASMNIATMQSKWGDAVLSLLSFDPISAARTDTEHDAQREFRLRFVHLFSLLFAVSCAQLRFDRNLANLDPNLDPELCPSEVTDEDDHCEHAEHGPRGSPMTKSGRTKVDDGRGGLDAAVQMSSEADTVRLSHMRNPLLVIGGLSARERNTLGEAADPQFIVMQWVLDSVCAAEQAKLLHASAPMISRVNQYLSDGQHGYFQALNVAKTPFPFPYAQAVALLMLLFTLSVPVLMAAWLDGAAAVASLTAISVWAYFALNEVNRDLEDPFLYEPNELPLSVIHAEFNQRLVSLQPLSRGRRWDAVDARRKHGGSDDMWRDAVRAVVAGVGPRKENRPLPGGRAPLSKHLAGIRGAHGARVRTRVRMKLAHVRLDHGVDGDDGDDAPRLSIVARKSRAPPERGRGEGEEHKVSTPTRPKSPIQYTENVMRAHNISRV